MGKGVIVSVVKVIQDARYKRDPSVTGRADRLHGFHAQIGLRVKKMVWTHEPHV
jgi:hypothetical protein